VLAGSGERFTRARGALAWRVGVRPSWRRPGPASHAAHRPVPVPEKQGTRRESPCQWRKCCRSRNGWRREATGPACRPWSARSSRDPRLKVPPAPMDLDTCPLGTARHVR